MKKYTPSDKCQKMARRMRIPSNLNEKDSVKVEIAIGNGDVVIHSKTPQERTVKQATQTQLAYIYEEMKMYGLVAMVDAPTPPQESADKTKGLGGLVKNK